jgi:hypothetical protein
MSVAALQALDARVTSLERNVIGRINGWEAAARLIGLSVPTIKKRAKSDPKFPAPASTTVFKRAGKKKPFIRPEWAAVDLLKYKNAT